MIALLATLDCELADKRDLSERVSTYRAGRKSTLINCCPNLHASTAGHLTETVPATV